MGNQTDDFPSRQEWRQLFTDISCVKLSTVGGTLCQELVVLEAKLDKRSKACLGAASADRGFNLGLAMPNFDLSLVAQTNPVNP